MLTPLYKVINFKNLQNEILDLVSRVNFGENQIICQGLDETSSDWLTGIGSIEELAIKEEKKYKFIHPELKGTELEKFIIKHNGFRARIMSMGPRQCYSVHADPTPRLHLPIITNNQCWMIWPKQSKCYQLLEGIVYWTDTTIPHTFVNGSGTEKRIHLVMCIDT
jgi:hypothetical protein